MDDNEWLNHKPHSVNKQTQLKHVRTEWESWSQVCSSWLVLVPRKLKLPQERMFSLVASFGSLLFSSLFISILAEKACFIVFYKKKAFFRQGKLDCFVSVSSKATSPTQWPNWRDCGKSEAWSFQLLVAQLPTYAIVGVHEEASGARFCQWYRLRMWVSYCLFFLS